MSMTDTIADMLSRIRNGQKSKLLYVLAPLSKMKLAILKVLKDEGYITDYKVIQKQSDKKKVDIGQIEITLKYSKLGEPAIQKIDRVSKPSKRIYSSISTLGGYYNNMGIYILTTPKGVISDRNAHDLKSGGEIICKVF